MFNINQNFKQQVQMKTILISSIMILTFLSGAYAQSSESEVNKEFYKGDTYLSIIIGKLPQGWTFTEKDGKFIIERKDSVWILKENRINPPPESKDQLRARIMANGVHSACHLILAYEKKWSPEKIEEARITNAAYKQELKKLADKYNISRFEDQTNSTRSKIVYKGKNKEEQKIVDTWEKEKAGIESKMIKTPDYHTKLYSLFTIEMQGYNNDNTVVRPIEAADELYTVRNMFFEICGK
jgi:hypothetical protein